MDGDMDTNMDNTADMDGDEPEADVHDESGGPPSTSLKPGEADEILMTFDGAWSAGTIIGCHVPGHWAAGMRIDVEIVSA